MGEKSEKHLYTEVGVFSLHSLNSPSCIIVSLHLCKSKDAIISIWKLQQSYLLCIV